MTTINEEWPPVEVDGKNHLPDSYAGLLDWVLDESDKEGLQAAENPPAFPAVGTSIEVATSNTQVIQAETFSDGRGGMSDQRLSPRLSASRQAEAKPKLPALESNTKNQVCFYSEKSTDDLVPQNSSSPAGSLQENAAEFTGKCETSNEEQREAEVASPPTTDIDASSWKLSALEGASNSEDKEAAEKVQNNAELKVKNPTSGAAGPKDSTQNCSTSVEAWVMSTTDGPVSKALAPKTGQSSGQFCEIDPETGVPLPKVEYPETRINHDVYAEADSSWRRVNMTSDMQIKREMMARAKLAKLLKQKLTLQRETLNVPIQEEENNFPRADCSIRPAAMGDVSSILTLIKAQERSRDRHNVLHVDLTTKEGIKNLMMRCKKDHRPFVVATTGPNDLLDRSKWPVGADRAYKQYLEHCNSLPRRKASVLGFAFALPRVDSGADCSAVMDHSCFVTLFVDPKHRHQKYGSALLDRILMSVSTMHRSLIDYDWKCEKPLNIYENLATHNEHKYSRVLVEYLDVHEELERLPGRKELLEKFGFRNVGHITCLKSKVDKNKRRCWLDLFIWEMEAGRLPGAGL